MNRAPILEARNIVKELGEGNAKIQALKGVNLHALSRGVYVADGTIRQR